MPNVRLGDGFPRKLPPPNSKPSSLLSPPAQVSTNAPPVRVSGQGLRMPNVHMWNFDIQREAPGGIVVTAAYVGRRGARLYRAWDANQIDITPILPSLLAIRNNLRFGGGCRPDGTRASGAPCSGAPPVPILRQGLITSTFANNSQTQSELAQNAAGSFGNRIEQCTPNARLRPNQQFARIMYIDNGGDSNDHAGQFAARRRFDQAGLLLNASCTVSKSIDNLSLDPVASTVGGGLTTTASRTPADARNYRNERARADYGQRHVLNIAGVYEPPFGRGRHWLGNAGRALDLPVGGWSLSGLDTYQSGEPFTARSGALTHHASAQSRAALKEGETPPQARLQDKPGVIGPVLFAGAGALTFREPGRLGLGRNIFQAPGFHNLDAPVSKPFAATERIKVTLRAEFFNALNHPNIRNPRDASAGSPAITSTVFGQTCRVTLSTASSATTSQVRTARSGVSSSSRSGSHSDLPPGLA